MAEKYGLLPSEVLQKGTTMDLAINYNANIIKVREQRKARGESIADTFTQNEIMSTWNKFKER